MEVLPNLLIVDDTEENLVFLKRTTQTVKVNVIFAFSGEEALKKSKGIELALAIIDIQMSEMDGHELALKLNQQRPIEKVPIIFLTSNIINETEQMKGYLSGAVDYISRPIDYRILLRKIVVFLDIFHQRKALIQDAQDLAKYAEELANVNEEIRKSEEKYRMLINLAPDAFFNGDAVGNFLDVNNSAVDLTGYSREELLNMHLEEILSPDYPEKNRLRLDLIEKGETVKIEREIIRRDSNKINIEMNSKKMPDGTVQSFFRDVTQRKIAEEALKKSEEKYRMLLNLAPDAFFQGNILGNFLDVNNSAIEMTGYSREELLKMNMKELFSVNYLEQNNLRYDLLEKGETVKIEREIIRKDGNKIYIEMNSKKMPDGTVQSFFRDITQRKIAEETLQYSNERLEEAQKTARIGNWEANLVTGELYWSEVIFEIFGIDIKSFKPNVGAFHNAVHPDDLELVFESEKRSMRTGLHDVVHRIILPNNQIRYVHELAKRFSDENGNHNILRGTVQDVTEQKIAEDALRNSEANIHTLVQTIPDQIWMKDTNGVYLTANKTLERYFGAVESDIIGKTDYDFVNQELAEFFRENDRRAIEAGKPTHNEEWITYPDNGHLAFLDTIKTPMYDSHGTLIGVLGIGRDFTDRKRIEEALLISQEKYKRMLKAAPASVLFIGLNGIINEISGIDFELFGAKTREDIVGKHFLLFVAPEEKPVIRKIIKKTMNDGISNEIELNLVKLDQSKFLSEIHSSLITGQNGSILAFMVSIRDISRRKEIAAKQYHTDRLASLGEVSAGLAHEINQPLNMIYVIIDKILFEYANTDVIDIELLKNKSKTIYENINRVKKILNHIKGFSRSQNEILTTTFDINSSIENAIMMISMQFRNLGIRFSKQLVGNLQILAGNTYRFEQVIINLLSNAKDAVVERKEKQKEEMLEMIVGIKSYREDNKVIIEISDNGIGIDNDQIKNLFVPYYSTKDASDGTGLGLPICYQIIKEMNGTIEFSSEKFYGTTVKIVFNI
ncbi:MAG: PAS domain S-box protein [bacterium]